MTRQQRRKAERDGVRQPSTPERAYNLAVEIKAVTKESAGALRISFAKRADVPEIIAHALGGDLRAVRMMGAIADLTERVRTAPQQSPMLCVACPQPIQGTSPYTVVLLTANCDKPERGLAFALCQVCANVDRYGKVTDAMAKIWPGLRAVDVHHQVGHA